MRLSYLSAHFDNRSRNNTRVTIQICQGLHDWNNGKANATILCVHLRHTIKKDGYIDRFIKGRDWTPFEDILTRMEPTPYVVFDLRNIPCGKYDRELALLLTKHDLLPQLVDKRKVLVADHKGGLIMAKIFPEEDPACAYEVDDSILVDATTMQLFSWVYQQESLVFYLCHPLKLPRAVHLAINDENRYRRSCPHPPFFD